MLYSKLDIEYQQQYSGPYRDLCWREGDSSLILAEKEWSLSGFGRPAIAVRENPEMQDWFKDNFLACPHVWFHDCLEADGPGLISQFLMREGHRPGVYFHQVIDLTNSYKWLHADLRKSYKSLVSKGTVHIGKDIGPLKELHAKVTGKETRPESTWDIQQKMIDAGEAFVAYDSSWSGAALFYTGRTAYYAVGSYTGRSHHIVWGGIIECKHRECDYMDMGEVCWGKGEKQDSIAMFKRGFGGCTNIRLEFIC